MNDMYEDLGYMGLDSHIPDKGWGYSVVAFMGRWEVCPFFDGDVASDMGHDVIICNDFVEVGKAIEKIMAGVTPRFAKPYGSEEE